MGGFEFDFEIFWGYAGGWVLDLGDGGDATHVKFVEVISGVFFLVFRGKAYWGAYVHASLRGVHCIGISLLMAFMKISYFLFSKNMALRVMDDHEHA